MQRRKIIALIVSIALVLVVVLTGCGNGGNGGNGATAVDKEYRVVNPLGDYIPVETEALSPRLDTIDGKTIYIIQGEADPVIMPALAAALPIAYPNTTFVFHNPINGMGASAPDDQTIEEADAIVRGNGW
ncbi:hypothetical protein ACFLTL_01265 [Chloroflexota bacterium]